MFSSLGNSIPRNGLVGEWLLDGNALDTSGNGNNGTATNITYSKTYKGYQVQKGIFDGTGYISIPNPTTYNFGTGSFAISMWIVPKYGASYQYPLIRDKTGASTRIFYAIEILGTSLQPYIYDSGNGGALQVRYTITYGQLYHIVFQRNRTSGYLELYVNGNKVNQIADNGARNMDVSGGLLNIGGISTSFSSTGDNQGVRIYNRALSQDEIQLLYLEGQKLLGPTNIAKYPKLFEGLVGYFENPTGTTELWNIATGVNSTRTAGTNTTDNLGNNKALTNPNYTRSSITYTTGYTFENSRSGWSLVTSPTGLSATGINRTTTLRNIFLFNRTLSSDEYSLLQSLCNSDYPYPNPSYDLLNLRDGLLLQLNGTNNGTKTLYDISGNGINGTVSSTPTYKRQGKMITISLSSQSISWTSTSFITSTCFEKVSGKWTLQVNPAYITTTGVTSGTREITDIRLYNRSLSTIEQEQLKYAKIGNFCY